MEMHPVRLGRGARRTDDGLSSGGWWNVLLTTLGVYMRRRVGDVLISAARQMETGSEASGPIGLTLRLHTAVYFHKFHPLRLLK